MKVVYAVAGLVLVMGCAPGATGGGDEPGAEAGTQTSPLQEDTTPPEDAGDGGSGGQADAVSVDLPGLPVGGNGAVFSADAPTQCVDVSWTGPPLPQGAGLRITDIHVPPEFTWDPTPCTDAPCVGGGFLITSQTGGCTVVVTWTGQPLSDPAGSVLSADGQAFCVDQATCDGIRRAADDTNAQSGGAATIGLSVEDATSDASGTGG
jgi:hypothetical protein